jgi:osmotically-inducible protein OsmY
MKSDAQLQQDVIAELKWEPSVYASAIGVEVKNGIVTLAGEVNSYSEKRRAELATLHVEGVKGLAVDLKIKIPGVGNRSDADIAHSVEQVLRWTANVPEDRVKVMVENGWVTLSGDVDWQYQKDAAKTAVHDLEGVRGIKNDIAIKPSVSSRAVKSDIEAALKRRAIRDAKNISVLVQGADVTLTGTVHSWSERELAENSAWNSPGVQNVIDKITVVR